MSHCHIHRTKIFIFIKCFPSFNKSSIETSPHSTIQKYFGGIEENPLLYRLKTYLKFRNSLHIWVDHSRGLEEPSLPLRTALRSVPHSYNIWRQFTAQGVTAQSSLGGPGVKTWHRALSDMTSQQGAQYKQERTILVFSFPCSCSDVINSVSVCLHCHITGSLINSMQQVKAANDSDVWHIVPSCEPYEKILYS